MMDSLNIQSYSFPITSVLYALLLAYLPQFYMVFLFLTGPGYPNSNPRGEKVLPFIRNHSIFQQMPHSRQSS